MWIISVGLGCNLKTIHTEAEQTKNILYHIIYLFINFAESISYRETAILPLNRIKILQSQYNFFLKDVGKK